MGLPSGPVIHTYTSVLPDSACGVHIESDNQFIYSLGIGGFFLLTAIPFVDGGNVDIGSVSVEAMSLFAPMPVSALWYSPGLLTAFLFPCQVGLVSSQLLVFRRQSLNFLLKIIDLVVQFSDESLSLFLFRIAQLSFFRMPLIWPFSLEISVFAVCQFAFQSLLKPVSESRRLREAS